MVAESKMRKNAIVENRPLSVRDTDGNRRRKPGLLIRSRLHRLVHRKLEVTVRGEPTSATDIVGK